MAAPPGVSPPVFPSQVLPPVVVLDACVLYPAAQRDLLMWLAASNPDAFLCRLLADAPQPVVSAFTGMRDNLRNPPKTSRECTDTLAAQGLRKFAGLIAPLIR